tara:strand:- start:541 stop:900 length:360 start_codon:yes stop_codon:yes gene_type:complete
MAITSDGTQAFGIDQSPITISGVTFVAEGLSWNFTGSRAEVNDSNGEPLGQTIIPGRIEVSGTLQLAADSTLLPTIGTTFTITSTSGSTDGDYYIQDVSDAQSQGDYEKVTFTAVRKLN